MHPRSQRSLSANTIQFEPPCDDGSIRDEGGLWDAPGRGTKPKWQEADMIYLEQCLEQQPRTYNMRQLAQILVVEPEVELSADRIRRIIKKTTVAGVSWKVV